MANRHWVGGGSSTNWTATGNTNWSATSGGANNASVPTAGDIVYFDTLSGVGTAVVSSGSVCRRLDCSGIGGIAPYAGTLAFTNQLTIGDTINGAYTFVAGMTVSGTAGIRFVNTITAPTNLTSAGKTLGPIDFNGAGGGWTLADAHTVTLGTGLISLSQGTLNTNGQTIVCTIFSSTNTSTRTLTLGASSITCQGTVGSWNLAVTTGLTFNANTSTITVTGALVTFQGGSQTYNNVVFSGSQTMNILGANTFANFTRTGAARNDEWLAVRGNQTITGTLTLNGNNAGKNRMLVNGCSAAGGVGAQMTLTAAAVVASNVDFIDIVGAGAANWNLSAITGGSGDGGGNSGITFTTAATQTWSGTSGGNWSANAWTTRVPLPQDDVNISAAFSASQTITVDMARMGKNVSFVGVTGSPNLTFDIAVANVGTKVLGSLTLAAGLGTVTITTSLQLAGYGAFTFTSAGKALAGAAAGSVLQVVCASTTVEGTYTLQDNLTITAINGMQAFSGTFTANGFNVTSPSFFFGLLTTVTSTVPTVNMGSGTWSVTSTDTGTPWNMLGAASLTLNASTSLIVISAVSANTRTFAGAGQAYSTLTYTVAGSTGQLTITGANTFYALNFSDVTNARTLIVPAATTTVASIFNVQGTSGKLMTVQSSSAGSAATLSVPRGTTNVDYCSIKDSAAIGGAVFYAGANSTNVSGNTGWTFTAKEFSGWGTPVAA